MLDLARRTGVDLDFHNTGRHGKWKDPRGLTDFNTLRVTLRFGMLDVQMRTTLVHELVHLDRGRRNTGISESLDESRTERLAAQRLIDPVVFDAVDELYTGKKVPKFVIHAALNVVMQMYRDYRNWRRRRKLSTALRAWREARIPTPWPAPWIAREVEERGEDAVPWLAAAARVPATS